MNRISKWFTYQKTALITGILFFVSMLPILYCSFFDYATGDDLFGGSIIKNVMRHGGSFTDAAKAVFESVAAQYNSFQGTWSSAIVGRLEPSIFGERFYILTPYIALFSLCGGVAYLLYEFLVHWCGLERQVYAILFFVTDFFLIQYMTTPRAGIFWYSGMTHYTLSFGIVLYTAAWILKYLAAGRKRHAIFAALGMAYVGGAGYPEVILSIMMLLVFLASGILFSDRSEKKRTYYLFLPFALLLTGFAVSAMAPGNKVRGGSNFGFNAGRALSTLLHSITAGMQYDLSYMIHVRTAFLLILIIAIIGLDKIDPSKSRIRFNHPILALIVCFLISCSVHAPELYAGDDVQAGISGGVYNSYYFVFVLTVSFAVFYLSGWIKSKYARAEQTARRCRLPLAVFILLFCLLFGRHLVGNTVDYTCMNFICSGQLSDFEDQMQERLAILNSDSRDVVVPEMNCVQGPFMHMALLRDPTAYTNQVTEEFYDKDSVIAIPRDEYNAKLKQQQ